MIIDLIAIVPAEPTAGIVETQYRIDDVGELYAYPLHRHDVREAFRKAFIVLTGDDAVRVLFSDEL